MERSTNKPTLPTETSLTCSLLSFHMRGNVWVLLPWLSFVSGEPRGRCTAWWFLALLWSEFCFALIVISFYFLLMISLFCFDADAIRPRWKEWCWVLWKWWLDFSMLAFCGSGLEGSRVKSSWYNRSSSICSALVCSCTVTSLIKLVACLS